MYVLNELGEPVLEPDTLTWGRWMEASDRTVAYTELYADREYRRPRHTVIEDPDAFMGKRFERETVEHNGAMVSTVFLGLDHNHFDGGPPILWETMIFGIEMPDGSEYDFQTRYTSRADALKGHARAVAVARRVIQENAAKAEK